MNENSVYDLHGIVTGFEWPHKHSQVSEFTLMTRKVVCRCDTCTTCRIRHSDMNDVKTSETAVTTLFHPVERVLPVYTKCVHEVKKFTFCNSVYAILHQCTNIYKWIDTCETRKPCNIRLTKSQRNEHHVYHHGNKYHISSIKFSGSVNAVQCAASATFISW